MASKILDRSKIFLRVCNHDMLSWKRFKWKKSGIIECVDFENNNQCGNGLHAFDISKTYIDYTASHVDNHGFKPPVFMAVEALGQVCHLSHGKVKFQKCRIIRTYQSFEKAIEDIMKMRREKNGYRNTAFDHEFRVTELNVKDMFDGQLYSDRKIVIGKKKTMNEKYFELCGYSKINAENCRFYLSGKVEIEKVKRCKLESLECSVKNMSKEPIIIKSLGTSITIPADKRVYEIYYGELYYNGFNITYKAT